jgi:hypothetical protein
MPYACVEHDQLDAALGRELGLTPWQDPAVLYPLDDNVAAPGSMTFQWEAGPARQLYEELCRAAGITDPPTCGPWERPVR